MFRLQKQAHQKRDEFRSASSAKRQTLSLYIIIVIVSKGAMSKQAEWMRAQNTRRRFSAGGKKKRWDEMKNGKIAKILIQTLHDTREKSEVAPNTQYAAAA